MRVLILGIKVVVDADSLMYLLGTKIDFKEDDISAEFVFDLAVLCGPGWEHGEHVITINFRPDDKELTKLGDIKVDIPSDNFVYNALANNLKFTIGSDVKNLSFIVMEGDKVIVERTYPVNGLMIPVEEKPKEESAAE